MITIDGKTEQTLWHAMEFELHRHRGIRPLNAPMWAQESRLQIPFLLLFVCNAKRCISHFKYVCPSHTDVVTKWFKLGSRTSFLWGKLHRGICKGTPEQKQWQCDKKLNFGLYMGVSPNSSTDQ